MLPPEGRVRIVVEGVCPEVDCGTFAVKRIIGQPVIVEADIFTDGHDSVGAEILYRRPPEQGWRRSRMELIGNDHWRGSFLATEIGQYDYTVEGWIDRFGTWRNSMIKRIDSRQDDDVEYLIGASLVEAAASRAASEGVAALQEWVRILRDKQSRNRKAAVLGNELADAVGRYPDRQFAARYGRELRLIVDRKAAGFSAWYEMFPRSCSPKPGGHGTLKDCEARIPYVAAMGFDILYLPPIHPIGRTSRKGKNNAVT